MNMKTITTLLLLIITAGISKAIVDSLRTETTYKNSIFSKKDEKKYNPEKSWKMMYKLNENERPILANEQPFYYFGLYKLKYKERFPYSQTFLASLTDTWHALGMIYIISLLSIGLICGLSYKPKKAVIITVISLILHLVVFTIFYNSVFKI